MSGKLREATERAFAAQVERALRVVRARGWKFQQPELCFVSIEKENPGTFDVSMSIDDTVRKARINMRTVANDVENAVNALVAVWLSKHGERPDGRVQQSSAR